MALSFYHPFFDHNSLFGTIDRQLQNAVRNTSLELDIEERPEAYLVSADLPGIGEEDVKVEIHQGILSIAAEKKVEKNTEGEDGKPVTVSRMTRSFKRSFRLPENVDEQGISASMDKGVLALNLPKKPESTPRRIAVSNAPALEMKAGPSAATPEE